MTILERKLDVLKRGIVLCERLLPNDPSLVQLVIFAQDTDGLKVECTPSICYDDYSNEETYLDVVNHGIEAINKFISKRHAQNPNNCSHDKTDLPTGKIGCFNCMAELGTAVNASVNNFKLKLDNN